MHRLIKQVKKPLTYGHDDNARKSLGRLQVDIPVCFTMKREQSRDDRHDPHRR